MSDESLKEPIRPQPGKQEQFLKSNADIVFYGGAAGGGKTYAILLEPLYDVHDPNFGAVIFRRTTKQVTSEGGLWDTAIDLYTPLGVKTRQDNLTMSFPSGAKVTFAHMEHEKNRLDWQGSQIPLICFDELTHFTWKQFTYLLSRNRSANFSGKSRVRATLNPDSDHWVRSFIDWYIDEHGFAIPERSGVVRYFVIENDIVIWADTAEELIDKDDSRLPKSFTFISSSLKDNKILMENDPGYLATLQSLTRVERAQLLDGNWNVRATAGMYFRRSDFEIVDAVPVSKRVVRGWDLASTKKKQEQGKSNNPDYTATVKMSLGHDGFYYIEHVDRFQEKSSIVDRRIKNTAEDDGKKVQIALPQDPGQAGKAQAEAQVRMLAGFHVKSKPVTGDKETRAKPLSSQVEAGNVRIVRGNWNNDFLNEMEAFPESDNDDMVDAASEAFNTLAASKLLGFTDKQKSSINKNRAN